MTTALPDQPEVKSMAWSRTLCCSSEKLSDDTAKKTHIFYYQSCLKTKKNKIKNNIWTNIWNCTFGTYTNIWKYCSYTKVNNSRVLVNDVARWMYNPKGSDWKEHQQRYQGPHSLSKRSHLSCLISVRSVNILFLNWILIETIFLS